MTAEDWKNATERSGIRTSTTSYVSDSSIEYSTTTTTTIGRTNLSVNSSYSSSYEYEIQSTKETSSASLKISYNVTDSEKKFIASVADKNVSLEQTLVVLDTLERNGGDITKSELGKIGIKAKGSSLLDLRVDTIVYYKDAFMLSKLDMSFHDVDDEYRRENSISNAFGVAVMGLAGGELELSLLDLSRMYPKLLVGQ